MRVVAFDPFLSPELAVDLAVEKVELDELFQRADFITLHTPLNEHTRGIVNAASIARMKPGVRIVNSARDRLTVAADPRAALGTSHVPCPAGPCFRAERTDRAE